MSDVLALDLQERNTLLADIVGGKPLKATVAYEPHDPNYFLGGVQSLIQKEAELIKKMVKEIGTKKKDVVALLPNSYTFAQIVEMPLLNEKELASAVQYKAEEIIPMPLTQANLDIEVLAVDKMKRTQYVLVVAAPKDIVDKAQVTLELTGLIPYGLETEASAVVRYLKHVPPQIGPQEGVVYAYISYNSTTLYAFHGGRKVVTQLYTFTSGKDLFIKDLAVNKNIDSLQAQSLLETYGFNANEEYDAETLFKILYDDFGKTIKRFVVSVTEREKIEIKQVYFAKEAYSLPLFAERISQEVGITGALLDTAAGLVIANQAKVPKLAPGMLTASIGSLL